MSTPAKGWGTLPDQPEQSFRSNVLSGLQFIQHQLLDGLGLRGGGLLPRSHFLQQALEREGGEGG